MHAHQRRSTSMRTQFPQAIGQQPNYSHPFGVNNMSNRARPLKLRGLLLLGCAGASNDGFSMLLRSVATIVGAVFRTNFAVEILCNENDR